MISVGRLPSAARPSRQRGRRRGAHGRVEQQQRSGAGRLQLAARVEALRQAQAGGGDRHGACPRDVDPRCRQPAADPGRLRRRAVSIGRRSGCVVAGRAVGRHDRHRHCRRSAGRVPDARHEPARPARAPRPSRACLPAPAGAVGAPAGAGSCPFMPPRGPATSSPASRTTLAAFRRRSARPSRRFSRTRSRSSPRSWR